MFRKPLNPVTPEEFEAMLKYPRMTHEVIDGAFLISQCPVKAHQIIAGNMYYLLRSLLKETKCIAIYGYEIPYKKDIYRPDMMVYPHKEALLPEIVFEVASLTTRDMDFITKVAKYQKAGIKEYWIIDMLNEIVIMHNYHARSVGSFKDEETISSLVCPEISFDVNRIFDVSRIFD